MRQALAIAVALAALPALLAEDKKPGAGCPIGSEVKPFEVEDVTGPSQSKKVCYVCQNGTKPVVLIFSRDTTKDVAGLVKAVGEAHQGQKKAGAFLVLLDDNAGSGREKLKKLAATTGTSLPLTLNAAGQKAPEGFALSATAKNNILIYKDRKVVKSFALDEISEKDVQEIVEAAKKNMEAAAG